MMKGGFLILVMGPQRCWTVLHLSILAGLLLTLNADSEDDECSTEIKVRRNTVYKASVGQELRINCTVAFCNSSPPTVSWYKLDNPAVPVEVSSNSGIKTEWITIKHLEGMSLLIFKKFLSNNSGQYHCYSGDSVSHSINISIYDNGERTTATRNNNTSSTNFNPEEDNTFWLYVCTAAGIVTFVIIVIIVSVILIRRCKRKSKKEIQTENQYMEIPMVEQPSSRASMQPPARGSPSVPPSQRSIRRKPQASLPDGLTPGDSEHIYRKITEDRKRQRNVAEEEGSSVVYAALNHQVPPRAAARPPRPQEECSEYAAIRVS